MCAKNCLKLSNVLTDCVDELMKILISEDEADSRFFVCWSSWNVSEGERSSIVNGFFSESKE